MSTGDLPKYAAKGERQKLDLDWIKLLHQEGLPPFLPVASDPPAKFGQAFGLLPGCRSSRLVRHRPTCSSLFTL